MPKDNSIFGLRFGSNPELQPTREELRSFSARPIRAGSREASGKGLSHYQDMIGRIEEFESKQALDPARQDIREKMFYGVLGFSSFFNPALKTAVEQYRYHLHALMTLDFRKPAVFIKSAEEEIGRLNPKKTDEAARRARMQVMIVERKRALDLLAKSWGERAAELSNIARYIRDNLIKIAKLCEGSIVVLVGLHIEGKEESRLVGDIKENFKERLRDSLHYGQLTRGQLEAVKNDVTKLSDEMSGLMREDVYSLTALLEAVHDHARKTAGEIEALLAKIGDAEHADPERGAQLFEQIEQGIVSLISAFHFELKAQPIRTETAYEDVLLEKRKELLDRLFELLHKERRSQSDRRSGEDRRKFSDSGYKGPERRQGLRRSGKSRR